MKKTMLFILIAVVSCQQGFCQQRITKKELELFKKNLEAHPLLSDGDADFKGTGSTDKWSNESAVILCQKTSFDFDRKGLSAGKRIGRNIWGIIWALPTFGASLYYANANNDTKILIEETERRKILLKDKFSLEQYSVLYFRLSTEGDAFAARVIKKDGSIQPVDIAEAIKVEDIKAVPGIFRSYTDSKFTAAYRPDYFKIAVSDLEEGDVIEYEFKNFNTQKYYNNPNYKEFDPVYYLCNRELPVSKQVLEVVMEDDKYYIGHKSLKGAPDFVETTQNGKKTYRWEDNSRDKMADTRYVNEFMEMPSVKFQVIYARNNSKSFVWFKDEADMKRELSKEELAEKASTFWFQPEKLQSTGDYTAGLKSSIDNTVKTIYKTLKKRGIADASDEEYVRKVYYFIRSKTLYNNWSDFAFAKVFSGLLEEKKIEHDIIVTTSNVRTDLSAITFTQEIAWSIKYKNKYYSNPNEHLNPEELPSDLSGNACIKFSNANLKATVANEVLPLSDTLENTLQTQINASLDAAVASNMNVDKNVEAKGLVKADLIDDILALTPFMETDYKNYDGTGMWEELTGTQEEKAVNDFNDQKKQWKEEKPKVMKALAENDYGFNVEKYNNFRLQQDGRSFKKRSLKYGETFTLADMTAAAGTDVVVSLPALIGKQAKIKKEERNRVMPVDVRYPRTLSWNIIFPVPAGYTARGIEELNKNISNECGSFTSTARLENGNLILDVKKMYKAKHFDVPQWSQLLEILDAAYAFSQSKIILKKQ